MTPVQKISKETWKEVKQEYDEAVRLRAQEVRRMKDVLGWSFQKIGDHFGIKRQAAESIYKQGK